MTRWGDRSQFSSRHLLRCRSLGLIHSTIKGRREGGKKEKVVIFKTDHLDFYVFTVFANLGVSAVNML